MFALSWLGELPVRYRVCADPLPEGVPGQGESVVSLPLKALYHTRVVSHGTCATLAVNIILVLFHGCTVPLLQYAKVFCEGFYCRIKVKDRDTSNRRRVDPAMSGDGQGKGAGGVKVCSRCRCVDGDGRRLL